MQVVFKVKTPKGQATGTNDKIKTFIIAFNKVKVETFVNTDDSEIIWVVIGGLKQIMRIQGNIQKFDLMIKNIFEHKLMQKYTGRKLSPEQIEELEEMLRNQTSVEIIKQATLQEQDEYNESFFDKVKRNWKKFNPFSSSDSSSQGTANDKGGKEDNPTQESDKASNS